METATTKPAVHLPRPRTFHEDGAIEIRCTILCNEKRLDIHVIDLEGVVEAARKQKLSVPWLEELHHWVHDLVAGNEDAEKLEITPHDLEGRQARRQPFPPGVAAPGAQTPGVERDLR